LNGVTNVILNYIVQRFAQCTTFWKLLQQTN